jgi:CHAD domain-containing protein
MSLSVEQQIQKKLQKETLTELLGKWNDRVVMIQHLQKTIEKAKINIEESALLESLKITISTEKKVLLNQIKLYIPKSELLK